MLDLFPRNESCQEWKSCIFPWAKLAQTIREAKYLLHLLAAVVRRQSCCCTWTVRQKGCRFAWAGGSGLCTAAAAASFLETGSPRGGSSHTVHTA